MLNAFESIMLLKPHDDSMAKVLVLFPFSK